MAAAAHSSDCGPEQAYLFACVQAVIQQSLVEPATAPSLAGDAVRASAGESCLPAFHAPAAAAAAAPEELELWHPNAAAAMGLTAACHRNAEVPVAVHGQLLPLGAFGPYHVPRELPQPPPAPSPSPSAAASAAVCKTQVLTAATPASHTAVSTGSSRLEADAAPAATVARDRDAVLAHPRYRRLVQAHVECLKVGADPEEAEQLEDACKRLVKFRAREGALGVNPALDKFMDSYIQMLGDYKAELERPFREAHLFCKDFEHRLGRLSRSLGSHYSHTPRQVVGAASASASKEQWRASSGGFAEASGSGGGVSGDEGEVGDEDVEVDPAMEDAELREQLKRKYRPFLGSLKAEFLKKRKKGKLPREATAALLAWWSDHIHWPYPTEPEKTRLAELTALDPKQINNWFINQRKRHWHTAEGEGGNIGGSAPLPAQAP
eukprot:SM000078S22130  [mRNA]  locus=s78:526676:529014:- [translate_table: standard]